MRLQIPNENDWQVKMIPLTTGILLRRFRPNETENFENPLMWTKQFSLEGTKALFEWPDVGRNGTGNK